MPQWIALSRTQHAHQHLLPRHGYHHSANERAVPVLHAELAKTLPHYLLAFAPKSEPQGERFTLVAVLGANANAYLAPDGRWFAPYIPAQLRGYPFALAHTQDNNAVLAVDTAHLVAPPDGQPLFTADGQLAEGPQRMFDFLAQCEKNRQTTQTAVDALASAGLLTPWPLSVATGEGDEASQRTALNGLYRVDEAALNQLPPDTLATLRGAPLGIAYGQLFSAAQRHALEERLRFHQRHAAGDAPPENLDDLFESGDDDLTFDFDS